MLVNVPLPVYCAHCTTVNLLCSLHHCQAIVLIAPLPSHCAHCTASCNVLLSHCYYSMSGRAKCVPYHPYHESSIVPQYGYCLLCTAIGDTGGTFYLPSSPRLGPMPPIYHCPKVGLHTIIISQTSQLNL